MRRGLCAGIAAIAVGIATLVAPVVEADTVAPSDVVSVVAMDGGPVAQRGRALATGRPIRLATPAGTAAVGLTWASRDPGTTAFAVRSLGPTGWSPWVQVADEADHGDGTTDARHGAGPVWTGVGTTAVEVVATGATPLDVALHTTGAADDLVPTPTPVRAPRTIRTSDDWASPGWSESNCPGGPSTTEAVDAVVVHHTATTNAYGPDQVDDVLRAIHRFHTRTRGWCDIAYQLLVDRFGQAWEGRTGGSLLAVHGGHARGFNTATTGIAVLGNHDEADLAPAVAETVATLAGWKAVANDFPATGTVVRRSGGSTSIPAGTVVRIPRVAGHRDVSSTSCPGQHAAADLDAIRERAAGRFDPPAPFRLGTAAGALVGDWDGDGDPDAATWADGVFDLRATLGRSGASNQVRFGLPGDVPVTGDWNGDGVDTVGVWRGTTFHLLDVNRTPVGVSLLDGDRRIEPRIPAGFPAERATPLVGDWDGDGVDTVGLAADGEYVLYADTAARTVLRHERIGAPGDVVVPLDWNADGTPEISLRRAGVLYAPVRGRRGLLAAMRIPDDRAVFVVDWGRVGLPTLVSVTATGVWDPTTPVGL